MELYSTNNKHLKVTLEQAVMRSLAPDKGLYMPDSIPELNPSFIQNLDRFSFQEIAFEVCKSLMKGAIPLAIIREIIDDSIKFPAPVVMLDDNIGSLELWHGPSMAFKDFGACFMAALMAYFIRNEDKNHTILVATSGDTGGAVASGFYDKPGIEVIILYPSGKVSDLQEKQLTTLGKNITALEINGTFDDCQALVKEAFNDQDLNNRFHLSSANSINIARLIPQSFYYFEAYKQVMHLHKHLVFSVPSGNFGNLTAGLLAKKMGLPVSRFIAATNSNHIFPDFLNTGIYDPKPAIATISNAMDVGDPSNFVRIQDMYDRDLSAIQKDVSGFWLNDEETRAAMIDAFSKYNYVCDPHGAIAYKALESLSDDELGIFLETAHPCKFQDVVEDTLNHKMELSSDLLTLMTKTKNAVSMEADFSSFKSYLLSRQ